MAGVVLLEVRLTKQFFQDELALGHFQQALHLRILELPLLWQLCLLALLSATQRLFAQQNIVYNFLLDFFANSIQTRLQLTAIRIFG